MIFEAPAKLSSHKLGREGALSALRAPQSGGVASALEFRLAMAFYRPSTAARPSIGE